MNDIIFLIGRILFGGFFVINGINHFRHSAMLAGYAASKKVPMPKLAVYLTGLLILLGGLGVVFGVAVDWALTFIGIFLVGVSLQMHRYWTVSEPNQRSMERVQFQKNMALLGATLMMFSILVPWAYHLW